MIVIVIGLLRTNLSGLYRHRRGLGFTWSRLQRRKYNIRIAKLVFHAKESPIRTRGEVFDDYFGVFGEGTRLAMPKTILRAGLVIIEAWFRGY